MACAKDLDMAPDYHTAVAADSSAGPVRQPLIRRRLVVALSRGSRFGADEIVSLLGSGGPPPLAGCSRASCEARRSQERTAS